MSVADGEYLLAVEGKPLTAERNVYERVPEHRRKPVEHHASARVPTVRARAR